MDAFGYYYVNEKDIGEFIVPYVLVATTNGRRYDVDLRVGSVREISWEFLSNPRGIQREIDDKRMVETQISGEDIRELIGYCFTGNFSAARKCGIIMFEEAQKKLEEMLENDGGEDWPV